MTFTLAAGGFDIGCGDLNALIEHMAAGKPDAPVAVFASYNASPYTIAVPPGRPGARTGRQSRAHM